MEELVIEGVKFTTFDLGGQVICRKIWKDYADVDGVVYMVDATDVDWLEETATELRKLWEMKEFEGVPICVLGNKIDKPSAIPEYGLREELGLPPHETYGKDQYINPDNPKIEVFMCSLVRKVGYADGLRWISQFMY